MANGIPTLLNQVANITNTVSLLVSDFTLFFNPNSFNWGIYFAGTNEPALIPDSVISFGYKKEYKISDYPVELGVFSNYNKVEMPYVAQVRMSVGSTSDKRSSFLDQLDILANSTELFDIATPNRIYLNANIIDYDYSRTSTSGAGMIHADIRLMEIRLNATTTLSNTQEQSDQSSVNSGQLSPSPSVTVPAEVGL